MIRIKEDQIRKMASQAMDELVAAVEAGKSEQLRAYLAMMGRFHRYSLGNQLLISFQRPDATRVAGYRTWIQLGRRVKRGEKAIRILAPIVLRPKNEDEDEKIMAFRTACIFDVSQTDGKPLAEFSKVNGDPGEYVSRLKGVVADNSVKLEYSNTLGPAQGVSAGGRIVLREDLDPAEEFSTLAHEFAHEILHQSGESPRSKMVRETEAEAVAFVVCQAVGLDANNSASDYIQLYDGGKKTLIESLERIQRTAGKIIRGVTSHKIKSPDRTAKTAGGDRSN